MRCGERAAEGASDSARWIPGLPPRKCKSGAELRVEVPVPRSGKKGSSYQTVDPGACGAKSAVKRSCPSHSWPQKLKPTG